MNDYINDYIDYLTIDKRLSNNTIAAYHHDLKLFINYLSRNILFGKSNDVESFLEYLTNNNISPRSRSRILSSLKSYYRYLLTEGKITGDPTHNINGPKTKKLCLKL